MTPPDTLGRRAGAAGRQAAGYTATAAGAARGGSGGWAFVGYALVLILLYVAVADKRVVAAGGKLAGGATTIAEAWVTPTDPIALLGERLGFTPSGTTSTAASAPSSAAAAGGSPGALSAGVTGGAPAPAPAAAASQAVAQSGLSDLLIGTPTNVSGSRLASVERAVKRAFPSIPAGKLAENTQLLLKETHKPGYSKVG